MASLLPALRIKVWDLEKGENFLVKSLTNFLLADNHVLNEASTKNKLEEDTLVQKSLKS